MLTNDHMNDNHTETENNAFTPEGEEQNSGDENNHQHDSGDEGSSASSKRSREEDHTEQTSALKKMASHARALNALRGNSKVFPPSGFKPRRGSINPLDFSTDDPEAVDNKLHLWRMNYSAALNENGERPEPTWLELYDNNESDAMRSFASFCYSSDCTPGLLSKAGFPPNAIFDLLHQNSVVEVKGIVEDCIRQTIQRPLASQTMVTTHVPALSNAAHGT